MSLAHDPQWAEIESIDADAFSPVDWFLDRVQNTTRGAFQRLLGGSPAPSTLFTSSEAIPQQAEAIVQPVEGGEYPLAVGKDGAFI